MIETIDSITGFFFFVCLVATFILRNQVLSTFSNYENKAIEKGITASQIARELLNRNGCSEVNVEFAENAKSDRFNSENNTLMLSSNVYNSNGITAISIVAHECGHAMQKRDGDRTLVFRRLMDPIALYSPFAYIIVLPLKLLFFRMNLYYVFFAIFLLLMLLSLAMLPLEYGASKRGLNALRATGCLSDDELAAVKSVMDAIAFNYAILVTEIVAILGKKLLEAGLRKANNSKREK